MSESKYKDHFPAEVVKLMSEGKSKVQVSASLGISYDTFNRYQKDQTKTDFIEAVRLGETLSEAYWEDIGQKGLKGMLAKFVPVAWIYTMKSRFRERWADLDPQKIELSTSVKGMSDKEIDDTIKSLVARKIKNDKDNDNGAQEGTL